MLWEQNDEVNKSAFEELKDDYCYEILRRLPLDDLCALSRTCTRLHSLCGKQFQEEYPSKVMRIELIQEDGTWVKEPRDEMYIKCFDKSIRNVILNGDGMETKLDAVNEFYKGEEMEGVVKEIHFNDWRSLDGAGIKLVDMLKSAETITIDYAAIVEDPYDGIFKYAPNLKHLTVRNSNFTSTDWLQQRYAKLESFEWHSLSLGPDANKIKSLLDTNPNIRRFSLLCTNVDDIVQLMAKDVKIDELILNLISSPSGWTDVQGDALTPDDIQFNYTMTVLMKLLAVQNVNLHLVVSKADIISQLAFVHLNVVGLQLNVSIDEVLTTMYTFDNLQFLRIAASHLPYAYADLIAKLPNLSQLYIDEIFCDNFETFHQTMLAAIGQLVKLTKISLNGFTDQLTKIDFLAFDQERMELHGAAHLKIYIHPKDFFASFPLKFVEFEMIEIIAAESEPSNYPLFLNYIHGMFGHKAINFNLSKHHQPGPSGTSKTVEVVGHKAIDYNLSKHHQAINFNLNNSRIDDGVLNYQHPADTWANWRCSQPDWVVVSGNADVDNWVKPNDASNFQKYRIDDSDDHHAGPSGTNKMVVADDSDWSN